MSRREKHYDDDDGRTIIDMSQVPQSSPFSGWTSGAGRERRRAQRQEAGERRQGEEQQPIPKEERRMFLKGAMKATLLIGLAYLAGLGLLIWIMTLIW